MRFHIFFLLSISAFAQQVGFGVKGGVTAGDSDITGAIGESKRYIVGPMVEVTLPLRLGIEVDALYSRLGYHSSFSNFAGYVNSVGRANSWEFPILLKYRLPSPPFIHPYVSGGIAPRYTSGTIRGTSAFVDIPTGVLSPPVTFSNKWDAATTVGVVIGGGIEFGIGHLRVAPEVRYTHWNRDFIDISGPQGFRVNATQNQARILLGVSWR